MIESGDVAEVKKDYLQTLESILQLILQKSKEKKAKISISVGRKQVYEGVDGERPSKNTVTPEQAQQITLAITDPKKTKGVISIKIGKETVYRVQDGKVTSDKLGLAPLDQAPTPEAAQKSKAKTPDAVESLQKQVQDLQSKLEAQQKQIEGLQENQQAPEVISKLTTQVNELTKVVEKQQQFIEDIQKSLADINGRSLPQAKNNRLQNWFSRAENKVKQTSKNLFNKIKDALTLPLKKLGEGISTIKSYIVEKLSQSSLFERDIPYIHHWEEDYVPYEEPDQNQVVEETAKAMIRYFGRTRRDGSRFFKSKNLEFEQHGDDVTIKDTNGGFIFQNRTLSPTLSQQQSQALDKAYSVVKDYQSEIDAHQHQQRNRTTSRSLRP